MRLIRVLFWLICLPAKFCFAEAAEAQASVYAAVGVNSFGFSNGGDFRFSDDTAALMGGGFYNFPIHSRLTAGLDGRVLYGPSSNGGTAVAAALRIGFVPARVRLRPYFELGAGIVSATANPGFAPQTSTNGAALFLVGLDVRITRNVDYRALEYGAETGVSSSSTTSGVAFLDTGLVYHIQMKRPLLRKP